MLGKRRNIISNVLNVIKLARVDCRKMCDETNKINTELPEEPTNCCMSGCEKCVWKQYAVDLIELYNHSGDEAKQIILSKIKDPTMQVFLKMELQFLETNKK